MDKSFIAFYNDNILRSFDKRDMLYFLLGDKFINEKDIYNKINSYDLYRKILDYISNNVKITENEEYLTPRSIYYHHRFGWTIQGKNSKAHLGKTSFNGKSEINIGNRSYLSGMSYVNGDGKLNIGNYCSIANGVEFFTSNINHPLNHITTYNLVSNARLVEDNENIYLENFENELKNLKQKNSISIENDVWIGRDVMILPGINIPNGCVIGAKTVITKSLKPYGVYVGSPAKLVRYRFNDNVISQLQRIKWWNWPKEKILKNKNLFDIDLNEFDGVLRDIIK